MPLCLQPDECDCAIWVPLADLADLADPADIAADPANLAADLAADPANLAADLAADLADRADQADSADLGADEAGAAELAAAAAAAAAASGGGGGARESYPRAVGSPAGGSVPAALLAGVYPNARGEGIGRAHLFALRQLVSSMR